MAETAAAKRAIILIPGLERVERFQRRDLLVANLQLVEARPLELAEDVTIAGETGKRLVPLPLRGGDGLGPEIDVFEAYWADMAVAPGELSPWARLWSGFDLLLYWVLSPRTWRAFGRSWTIAFGLMAGGVLLLLWYLSLAILVAAALRADPTQTEAITGIPLLKDLLDSFFVATGWIASTAPWAIITLALAAFKADELAAMAQFSKDYLENRRDDAEAGLRDRVRLRVAPTLQAVLAEPYDEVVIVAHSFGSVIAIDLLAGWPHPGDWQRLRLVTLGSPEAVLECRSHWLAAECRQLLERRPHVWIDCFSRSDWLCTAVTGHKRAYPSASRELDFEGPRLDRLTGRTHLYYYHDARVLEILASPALE